MFKEKYDGYLERFNGVLDAFCKDLKCRPQILEDSLKYSLNLGGKRFRPVLMYAVGDLLGVELSRLDNFALALELIHTYSLIHDDLPDMDDDDFRRGKPSNHKVFGNANAILAGDGLLNTAYAILLKEARGGAECVSAAEIICDCAGIYGMIAGQSADLLHENDKTFNKSALEFIYINKTSKLLMAALMTPTVFCSGKHYAEFKTFGENLGILFQLCDDILDVEGNFETLGKSIGKDEKEGKYTAVSIYGLDACKLQADELAGRLKAVLEGVSGDTSFLMELVDFVRNRTH